MSRYARQIALPGFGAAAQDRLTRARLLVVGAGGLAAPVLHYLVGAGVGFLRLVDPDRVDLSNLHRQTLFRMAELGRPKVEAAAAAMNALNPEVRVEPHVAALDPANAAALAEGCDLVLDCADSFAASYILSDLCQAQGLPLLSASVTGREGYAGGFCGGAPSLRALFPDLPQRMGSCAETGVLGPVVGLVGALQAQMALAVLTGADPSPLGQLVTVDGARFRFGGFRFDGAPEPEHAPRFIAASEFSSGDLILDLRPEEEAPLAHPSALRSSVETLPETLRSLPPQRLAEATRLCLVCRSGLRSWHGAERLLGLTDLPLALVAMGDPSKDPA
ncbi:molybdopterin/thiamine biosynthesis adenylyltransferase [Cereibacter changlensis]|uniref:Molybdopterin/thiamine biosynthesis adenylyltransferase n=2 Tax=Cereibacter changlensis TaxID=402884 RepID=A0A2W7RPZ8_9RHOB|nr:HesA/MoeB/ThiF family protein [Cereibacter changlensis]PZX57517.1 molybdopterin/thiamine biosynthesis adenylyltransferase [Cereibacter changlensis]